MSYPASIDTSMQWDSLLSKMMREAHPIEAAERRQYVAPGASPGISALSSVSTVGATDSVGSFVPAGLDLKNDILPGLTPGLRLAYARGYILSPLRGSIRTRLRRDIQFENS